MTLSTRLRLLLAVPLPIRGRLDLAAVSAAALVGIALHQRAWSLR